jgi:transposase
MFCYADAGYDAEWVHDECRLDWGAESVIKPAKQRADGTRCGFWRSRMSEQYLERKGYGSRWAVESFFSRLKRTTGSTLTFCKRSQILAEAAFKVLAYTLRRKPNQRSYRCFQQSILGLKINGAVHNHTVFRFQILRQSLRHFFLREDVRRVAVIGVRAFHQRLG